MFDPSPSAAECVPPSFGDMFVCCLGWFDDATNESHETSGDTAFRHKFQAVDFCGG